jgi:hypothetical protein
MHPSSHVIPEKISIKCDGLETLHICGRGTPRHLVGKPERKRPLGSPGHRWEDNIKTDLQEIMWGRGLDLSNTG